MPDQPGPEPTVEAFHRLYYESVDRTWMRTFWLGVPAQKCPLDLWIYQEIIFETRPDVIVECGTYKGGTSLFCACVCELIGHGRVVTIDIQPEAGRPPHPRIHYVTGSSVAPATVKAVRALVRPGERVMVILDSLHDKGHVLQEMRLYGPMVAVGCYLIVEDTNINGHPVLPGFGPGPAEAVQEFLQATRDFVVDREREKFLLTFNPGGYLRRVK